MNKRPTIEPAILEAAYREFVEKGEAILDSEKEPVTISLHNYKEHGLTYEEAEKNLGLIMEAPRPLPAGAKERLERLIHYRAPFMFEMERLQFIENYGGWKTAFIEAELEQIDKEIAEAQEMPFGVAISTKTKESIGREYLRLKEGFYEAAILPADALRHISKTAAAYGRYFLFREYLQERLSILLEQEIEEETENKLPSLAETHLAFMQGKNLKNGARILNSTDYQSMIKALDHYLNTGEVLDGLKPIQPELSKAVFIYALKKLHRARFGNSWISNFYPLLQALFKQCNKAQLKTLQKNYTKIPDTYDDFVKHGERTSE